MGLHLRMTLQRMLLDESQDISGKKQHSTDTRFFDEKRQVIRKEFIGIVELDAIDLLF